MAPSRQLKIAIRIDGMHIIPQPGSSGPDTASAVTAVAQSENQALFSLCAFMGASGDDGYHRVLGDACRQNGSRCQLAHHNLRLLPRRQVICCFGCEQTYAVGWNHGSPETVWLSLSRGLG